jgi:hypothetical protein
MQTTCRARVESASCAVSRVGLFLVLLRTAKAVGLWASAALGVVPVEALGALDSFQLGFDDCSCNSCSKDP